MRGEGNITSFYGSSCANNGKDAPYIPGERVYTYRADQSDVGRGADQSDEREEVNGSSSDTAKQPHLRLTSQSTSNKR
eukprot:2235895-Pyramimonas_sp.AAC.1